MRRPIPHLRAGAVAAVLACTVALAQEPAQEPAEQAPEQVPEQGPEPTPEEAPIELPPLPVLTPPGGEESAREEMIKLFQDVEQRLGEIDDLLYDASAGEALDAQDESGIGDLLQRSIAGAEEVRAGMDRILELAAEQGQSQSQSGGKPGSEKSPLDAQPQGQEGSKESTPENPTPQDSPQQQPQGQEPGGQSQPKSPRDSVDDPQNNAAADPTAGETGSGSGPQGNERWGDLPTHVRDLFRTEGGGDMPPQYRDWIDAYYRRLNQRP